MAYTLTKDKVSVGRYSFSKAQLAIFAAVFALIGTYFLIKAFAAGTVAGAVTVSGGVAKVRYTLTGVACPAQVDAVATLGGAVKGKASLKVPAGKPTVLSIPVKGASGKATFKIVLKTNGRPTTQVADVTASVR